MEQIGKTKIRQPGMNPWRKNLTRMIYRRDDGRTFIIGKHCAHPEEIGGKEYTEVVEVLGCWFIK